MLSMRRKRRETFRVIARLVREFLFAGMAHIEKLEGAFKELIDLLLGDFVRSEEGLEIEVGESAISDAGGEKLAQSA